MTALALVQVRLYSGRYGNRARRCHIELSHFRLIFGDNTADERARRSAHNGRVHRDAGVASTVDLHVAPRVSRRAGAAFTAVPQLTATLAAESTAAKAPS